MYITTIVKGYYCIEEIEKRTIQLGLRWCRKKILMAASYPDFPNGKKWRDLKISPKIRKTFYKSSEVEKYLKENLNKHITFYSDIKKERKSRINEDVIKPCRTPPSFSMFRNPLIKRANDFYRILNDNIN